jgi:hypothetical protein
MENTKPAFLVSYIIFSIVATTVTANQPPVLDSIGPKTAVAGLQIKFDVTARDPDGSPPTLFPLIQSMPRGALLDSIVTDSNTTTGKFRWTPDSTRDSSQVGIHEIIFYATDGQSYDSEVVVVDVKEAGYDPGITDTVALVVTQKPNAALNQLNVELALYVFSDSTIVGASMGFRWDNPNLKMDSAIVSALIDSSFGIGPWLYEDGDITVTNDSQRFIFLGSYYPPDSSFGVPGNLNGRRLWATYYFTLSSWSPSDSIVIDSVFIPPSISMLFTVFDFHIGQIPFIPYWKKKVVIKDAATAVTEVESINRPNSYALIQNYPNPFNLSTEIRFDIAERAHVTLTIFNVMGQQVATLVDEVLSPKSYVVEWDGTSYAGAKVASGVYFYKLEAGDFVATKKMILLK